MINTIGLLADFHSCGIFGGSVSGLCCYYSYNSVTDILLQFGVPAPYFVLSKKSHDFHEGSPRTDEFHHHYYYCNVAMA
ncbi:MAG: hypothetical protein MJE68_01075, partial [Proteobacteria bacterium]|nr:hypothetical protein [Pseudomonadota bacterium]